MNDIILARSSWLPTYSTQYSNAIADLVVPRHSEKSKKEVDQMVSEVDSMLAGLARSSFAVGFPEGYGYPNECASITNLLG
ncbi:MAG: hypothetical protein AAGG51_01125 [Cyanobacteria bacterium P01_G01_bin.54]